MIFQLLIPILTVEEITKEKTARIIPNAVGITTSEDKHIFGSLMSRDSTLAYMKTVWEKAKSEETVPEPEITVSCIIQSPFKDPTVMLHFRSQIRIHQNPVKVIESHRHWNPYHLVPTS